MWAGLSLAEERDAANNVTKRFFAQGEQIAGQSYFFTHDHLGSVRELTDSTQTVKARYDYGLYGLRSVNQITANPIEADFGYTGLYFHPPSGLHLATYRTYNASTGRWLSRDLISEEGGINLYGYVNNQPSKRTDRLGLLGGVDDVIEGDAYVSFMLGSAISAVIIIPLLDRWFPVKPLPAEPSLYLDNTRCATRGGTPLRGSPSGAPPMAVPGDPDASRIQDGPQRDGVPTWTPDRNIETGTGGQPAASWDPEGHWDVDNGNGDRARFDWRGNPISGDNAHSPDKPPMPGNNP